jgi:ribosomal protein S18 acetylase RimI-like enzyme
MVDHLLASPSPIEHDASESRGEANARTNTYPRLSAPQSLSAQLWGLDFNALLPRTLSVGGTRAVVGEIARVRTFLSESFPMLTEEALGTRSSAFVGDAKRRYLSSTCDLIELRHGDETVGAFVGAPEDWSTYYVRIFAVARQFQQPGLVRKLIRECIFEPLEAHGVQRIAADTSPANRAMSRLFSELKFHVTGQQLSDRWGPMVRYTKFLDAACEAAFLERFAGSAPPAGAGKKQETGT